MGFSAWAAENWFDLIQTAGIIAGLLFTAHSLRLETKTRRVANLITITEGHRKIWTEFNRQPELARVLDANADLQKREVTREEEIFVNFIIFQIHSTFYAQKVGLVFKLEGLRRDVAWLFSLPIPRVIWERAKELQNHDFVYFIETCLKRP